jgi:hypothetical protein
MRLIIESYNEDEIYLFERIVKHLQSFYGYSSDQAVELINRYYLNFTDPEFCNKNGIPVQTMDFFGHIEARGMADRVQYYEGLNNSPDEQSFIEWQRKIRN